MARRDLLPAEHYLDSGYFSAELISGARAVYGISLVTPVLLDTSPQVNQQGRGCACTWCAPCRSADRVRVDRGQGRRTPDSAGHARSRKPGLMADRDHQTLIGDMNYFGRDFEQSLAGKSVNLLRPAREGEPERAGPYLFKPLRQTIEMIN